MEFKIVDGVLKIYENGDFYNMLTGNKLKTNINPEDKTFKNKGVTINKKRYYVVHEFYKAFIGELPKETHHFTLKNKNKEADKHNIIVKLGAKKEEEIIDKKYINYKLDVRPYSFKAFDIKGDLVHETNSMVEMGKILNIDVMEMVKVMNKSVSLNGYFFFKKYINDKKKA